MKVPVLFCETNGAYFDDRRFDPWDKQKDAFKYKVKKPVIAHPPCERWGRYWSGGPSAKVRRKLGDDGGAFRFALEVVRNNGGVIEHPEASHAFKVFGLPIPDFNGGWTEPDEYGGRSCCVAQGNYGHRSRKMTWLYLKASSYPELIWGPTPPGSKVSIEQSVRGSGLDRPKIKRIKPSERLATPEEFRTLLHNLVRGCL